MTEEDSNGYQLITNLSLERGGKLLRHSTKIECPSEEDELDKLRQEIEELRDLVSSLSSVNSSVLSSKQKKKLSSLGLLSEQNNVPVKNIPQVNESYFNQIQQPLFEGTLVNHFKNKSSLSDSYPFFESTIYADGLRNIPNIETKYWKLYPFGMTGNITELANSVKAKLYPPVGDYFWITLIKKDNYYTPISDTDDILLRGASTPWRIKIRARFTIDVQAETPQIENYTGYSVLQVAQEIDPESSEYTTDPQASYEEEPILKEQEIKEETKPTEQTPITEEPQNIEPVINNNEPEIRVEVMDDVESPANNRSISEEEEFDVCEIPPESAPPVYDDESQEQLIDQLDNNQESEDVSPISAPELNDSTNSNVSTDIDSRSEDSTLEVTDTDNITPESNPQIILETNNGVSDTNDDINNDDTNNDLVELEALVESTEEVPQPIPDTELAEEITETALSDDNDPREPECHSDSDIVVPLEYEDQDVTNTNPEDVTALTDGNSNSEIELS